MKDIEMTSTLHDTGEIRLGGTRDLTYLTQRPIRRPEATGENPIYQPATIGIVPGAAGLADAETMILAAPDELTRLAAGETMVLPVDATPAAPRHAVATAYQSEPAASGEVRPPKYRGIRRAANPPWAYLALGAGALALGEFVAGLAVLAVAW